MHDLVTDSSAEVSKRPSPADTPAIEHKDSSDTYLCQHDNLPASTDDEEKTVQNADSLICTSCGQELMTAEHDKDNSSAKPAVDPNIVDWDGPDDPEKPSNWPRWKKVTVVGLTGLITFMVSFTSASFTPAIYVTAVEFSVASEVMLLGLALYIFGFACGPMVWGPASELYGRTMPLWVAMFVFCIFQIPVGVAQNVPTILVSRFIQGAFGTAPLAIVGGMYHDFLSPVAIGVAGSTFMATVFAGSTIGPIAGSLIVNSSLGWRWISWISLIFTVAFLIPTVIFVPETSTPVLLRRKAQRLRRETKNFALHAKSEESSIDAQIFIQRYLTKPVMMIIKEPILMILTIYMSLAYGIFYLLIPAIPYSFQVDRRWGQTDASLPFIGILIGVLIATGLFGAFCRTWFAKQLIQRGKPFAEDRLHPMILGSVVLPVGLFWFAWSSHPSIHWSAQAISCIFVGGGIMLIFLTGQVYLIDVYLFHANSALAINAFVRCLFGGAFPLFSLYMYQDLGVDWAMSVLAFICLALMPFPFLFWKYGEKIRAKSKFAFVLP